MRCAFFHPATGEVVQTAGFPGGADVAQTLADAIACDWIELTENEAVAGIAYVQDGQLHLAGEPPAMHAWDWSAKAWGPDLAAAKAAKLREIERERDRRITAVIAYAGANVDADERAQKNVSNKLAEIAQREALSQPMPTELLVWRDADNNMHAFATPGEYLAWLGGLAVAMAERGTLAYAWSWQAKAAAAAATTLAELDAISLTS
jgi:Domain of unknown function (DUF4376)